MSGHLARISRPAAGCREPCAPQAVGDFRPGPISDVGRHRQVLQHHRPHWYAGNGLWRHRLHGGRDFHSVGLLPSLLVEVEHLDLPHRQPGVLVSGLIPDTLLGVAYVAQDGIPDPVRVRFAWHTDTDIHQLTQPLTDGPALTVIEGEAA
jgi:hypothetical protein